jgi:cytochrome c
MSNPRTRLTALLAAVALSACGGDRAPPDTERRATGELTQEQIEKGIGPVRSVALGPIDPAMRDEGRRLFEMLCTACHQLDDRRIGPPLRGVTRQRTPEFVMNMMLNPTEMIQRHPVVQQLFAEYNFAPMADQNLTEEQARAILEYLRAAAEGDV